MKLHENSLFAILLRARWWVSFLVAFLVFFAVRAFFGYGPGFFMALPFLVIGIVAGWRQLRRPSGKKVAATLERARGLPWEEFCAELERGFRRGGYSVKRSDVRTAGGADFELAHQGFVTLVAAKRWKAVRTGVEPLKEFDAATLERGAHIRMYIAAGEITDTAKAFAAERKIRLVQDEELAQLLQ
jgi:restriction system protein